MQQQTNKKHGDYSNQILKHTLISKFPKIQLINKQIKAIFIKNKTNLHATLLHAIFKQKSEFAK